jgi:hypothetical protein
VAVSLGLAVLKCIIEFKKMLAGKYEFIDAYGGRGEGVRVN